MTQKQLRQKLEDHFIVGTIVDGYCGEDKVLAFDWNEGNWAVLVQAVNKDGTIDKRWPSPRRHSTFNY